MKIDIIHFKNITSKHLGLQSHCCYPTSSEMKSNIQVFVFSVNLLGEFVIC